MKIYSNSISIVHSNFRMKEHLYLFIQALFVSGTDTGFRDLQFLYYFQQKISQAPFIMRPFGLEIKVEWTFKVQLTLLVPASPWPWCQRWTLLRIQRSGVYRRELWWPGSWQAWPRRKAWSRLRLCALARISKIMIPLNPSNDLLPSFWTIFTHLVTSPWPQLAYICAVIEFYHQYFSTINM